MTTSNTKPLEFQSEAAIGLALLGISFFVFAYTVNIFETNFDIFSGVFFINYGITIIYLFLVLIDNKQETNRLFKFYNFRNNVILLQLFNISAYSLNRTVPVFQISTDWLVAFLLTTNILLLIHVFRRNYQTNWLNYLIVIAANLGIIFHFYESIYMMTMYPYSIIGFWFFGIPLHTFVPFLFTITFIHVVKKYINTNPKFWATTVATWVFVFALGWVQISQELPKSWITKRALKAGLVYMTGERFFFFNGARRLNERAKHDPLVVVATFFSGIVDISGASRIKILNSMFDARHQTERKLWSGENLSTTDIVTNVQLFPEHRLAYTEKTFKIKNSRVSRWGNQQEALYTFYLPEGSVVTSAALWVEGEERPAFLTTKSKADSAYTTIVGRERRDPLLLHWKEGNRVTVRVFPCTPQEDRQFKIGITTPLKLTKNRLLYENIDFKGPYWKGATESINVVSEGDLSNLSTPYSFSQEGLSYTYSGGYKSDWSLEFNAPTLSTQPFSFNGKAYQLQPFEKEKIAFDATEIYLDINAGWSKREFNSIWKNANGKSIFMFSNNKMEKVTADNRRALFRHARKQNFTMFPFFLIKNPSNALVISKFNQLTPTLSDLKTASALKSNSFLKSTSEYFNKTVSPIRTFNLSDEISPYLKTLKELRSLQLEQGTLSELTDLLEENSFYQNQENERTITNHYGGFQIKESRASNNAASTAPDHLMRLFAYNDVLKKVGKDYFDLKSLANEIIHIADEAYVVTPISSLLVLETQEDYDRFDIKKSKNSLDNASIGNSGSVPEPHEWLLIVLVLSMTLYFYLKR